MWNNTQNQSSSDNEVIFISDSFPELNVKSFKDQYRIPPEMPSIMINDALKRAAYFITKQLPRNIIFSEMIEIFFFRAVFCQAKAELLREAPTFMRAKAAENPSKYSEESEDVYQELSNRAIRMLLNKLGSATIELI